MSTRPWARWIAGVLIAAVFLSGCSKTRILYRYSDWYFLNRLDHYFQLKETQRTYLDRSLGLLLAWHGKEELPRIADHLREFQNRYRKGLTMEDLDWASDQHGDFWKNFIKRESRSFSTFLSTLDENQILHLSREMENSNDWMVRQTGLDGNALKKDTTDWIIGFLEDWLGNLYPGQNNQIKNWVEVNPAWTQVKLRNRRHSQGEFLVLLKAGKTPEEIYSQLSLWIDKPESLWLSDFKTHLDRKKHEWKVFLLQVNSITTQGQRDYFLNRVQEYIDDFESLARESA
ncbi:MAG: hypothetical protein COV67_07220 [Nitrospinae bacterium CG11_big_fil_rev_8_21_14_0_20_56_8]|nr:MAG: hypothetical protein COV67_07220 [Nitrospinae bacterium CG11_big_fil_rev_8_21_14_0_20_56_8]